jgi:ATP-dependent RNA helicase SUPV3L1/SUV3
LADATRSVALLGPTNTGKTHRAVERMLEHETGMLGLPLRLLAREIYDRVTSQRGEDSVALVTGEEKRIPRRAKYWICTTEAMPRGREVDFLAVDEVQLATHDERGHVFTDRLLHARGREESWFMGSLAMRPMLEALVPAARHQQHPRLSQLSFAGSLKLQRLPPRSAVVAFSHSELYELAGRLRQLRGGAALVLGALSPRARNAQVAMFQAGEVDYLVATDAIGMGLNLDVSHVAFASLRKFDGQHARRLELGELGQIAGRAGRYLRDGTFGTIAPLELDADSAAHVEQHRFEPIKRLRYRNTELDFSSPTTLMASLQAPPPLPQLSAVSGALDGAALAVMLRDESVAKAARRGPELELLWKVCEVPDFRRILFEVHVALLRTLFFELLRGPISSDSFAARLRELDDERGDVDTLLGRLSRLRTWAYVAHRPDWLAEPELWREQLSALEDRLSDALHARLVDTYVERRPRQRSAMARPRAVPAAAPPLVEGLKLDHHHPFAALERLRRHLPEAPQAPRTPTDLEKLADAPHEQFELDEHGTIRAQTLELGRLVRGADFLQPEVRLAQELELAAGARTRLQRRLLAYARDSVNRLFASLDPLRASGVPELRAVAYQLQRGLGAAEALALTAPLATFKEEELARLAEAGVRAGALCVYLPALQRPPALAVRRALVRAFTAVALPPLHCATAPAPGIDRDTWLRIGYIVLGPRALRVDLAERAARALRLGADEAEALRCLSLPKRERIHVGGLFRRALEAAGGAAVRS